MGLFLIQPDGSGRRQIELPPKLSGCFIGQPAWHPDGEHIIIQVENEHSRHTRFEHPSFGFHNDLWLIRRDGSQARRIWRSGKNHAALHPHFSPDGKKLIFAERLPTGKKKWFLRMLNSPGGENQWLGWRIHLADVELSGPGETVLSNHRTLFENWGGFFETHGFNGDRQIVFSHTPGGQAYIDDIYIAGLDGKQVRNLTRSPATWEEHGNFSPDGSRMAFISSRCFPDWAMPGSTPLSLRTELFLLEMQSGQIQQLTHANQQGLPERNYLVSDFDWNRDGTQIVFQVGSRKSWQLPGSPELYILTVPPAASAE